jgi:hypothetical protein
MRRYWCRECWTTIPWQHTCGCPNGPQDEEEADRIKADYERRDEAYVENGIEAIAEARGYY